MSSHQDWNDVVWSKPKPSSATVAKQRGYNTTTIKRIDTSSTAIKNKIDKNEIDKLPRVKKSFSQMMQKARLAKKMTQKQLAQAINEKPQVINQYESGRAIPTPAIISKIRRVLQIKGKIT